MRKILIAGASGFIGHALIEKLLLNEDVEIVGLSRTVHESHHSRLIWKKCDLFSLKDITEAMENCVEAYYLVHSMLPSASLSQGTFYDFDLIMADNFVRAAKRHRLEHIIYLGGMIPASEELSWHLRSRLEVEKTFRDSGIRTTVLRAGLIIGPNGSSFIILQRLIERLPLMICPNWTKTRSAPVGLNDIVKVLIRCLFDKSLQGRIYDMAGPEVLTYQELMIRTAKKIRKSTKIFTLNIIPLSLSRLWVTLVTGVPKNLVYPLILSLRYEMLPSPLYRWPYPDDLRTGLNDTLEEALSVSPRTGFKGHKSQEKEVRSIQRLVLPSGKDATWAINEYFQWLPTFFSTLIRVTLEGEHCIFYFFHPSIQILVLKKSIDRSTPDRQLLYVIGGLLSGKQDRGRLEFREVLGKRYIMAALHDFRPALPWYIYRYTQAIVHLLVMKAFGEHLKWYIISGKR